MCTGGKGASSAPRSHACTLARGNSPLCHNVKVREAASTAGSAHTPHEAEHCTCNPEASLHTQRRPGLCTLRRPAPQPTHPRTHSNVPSTHTAAPAWQALGRAARYGSWSISACCCRVFDPGQAPHTRQPEGIVAARVHLGDALTHPYDALFCSRGTAYLCAGSPAALANPRYAVRSGQPGMRLRRGYKRAADGAAPLASGGVCGCFSQVRLRLCLCGCDGCGCCGVLLLSRGVLVHCIWWWGGLSAVVRSVCSLLWCVQLRHRNSCRMCASCCVGACPRCCRGRVYAITRVGAQPWSLAAEGCLCLYASTAAAARPARRYHRCNEPTLRQRQLFRWMAVSGCECYVGGRA